MENQNNISDKHQNKECIWMEANVVAYKLCDLGFECEKCPFDFVMRNTWKEKTDEEEAKSHFGNNNLLENYIKRISNEKYDNKIIYLKNQIVLKQLFGGVYSIGLSPLLADILDGINEINFLKDFGQIKKGDEIIEIVADWGTKKITAPMNFTLLQKMDIDIENLLGDIWFGVVSVSLQEISPIIFTQVLWRTEFYKILNRLRNYQSSYPQVGVTMMDGGKNIEYLYQAIGADEYKILLDLIFID